MVVYSFSRCFAAEYISTTRCLSQRIREHHPAWLRIGGSKSITSSVVAHLANTNHIMEPTRAFRVIYKAPLNQLKFIRQSIFIHKIVDSFNIQLDHVNTRYLGHMLKFFMLLFCRLICCSSCTIHIEITLPTTNTARFPLLF